MSKKSIIALITVIVLLFAAGISVGVFLYTKGTTQATDGNQTTDQIETPEDEEQVVDGNPVSPDDNTATTGDNENTNTNNEATDNNVVDNNTANNAENTNTVGNANIGNTGNVGNAGVTTDTGVNKVGETIIERIEEQERLVSKDFWNWWQPMTVSVQPTEVGIKLPEISVKKAVITPTGSDKLVYVGQDITYVIAITNNSDIAVENIEVKDKMPEKTTYVENSIEDPVIIRKVNGELTSEIVGSKSTVISENKTVGVKWLVSIPAGETVIARFTVKVDTLMQDENGNQVETVGTVLNTAIANGEESNEVQTSIIKNHKSSIVKRDGNVVDSKIAKIGDQITYTISVENTGDVDGISYVMDEVPQDTKFISAQEGAKVTTIENEKTTILWSVSVPAHTTITREFTVEVLNIEGQIKNIANVGGTPTNEDIIDTADINVEKTATAVKRAGENEYTTPVGEVKENDIIQYTIVVTNTGSKDLTNVLLEEQLVDIEITELEVDGIKKDINYNNENKLIIGNLKAAKEATEDTEAVDAGVAVIKAIYQVTYEADIKNKGNEDGTIIPIYNKVIAIGETIPDSDKEPEKVDDNDDETVPVAQDPRFEITKTAIEVGIKNKDGNIEFSEINGKVKIGDIIKYKIVITNTGNTKLTNIIVKDTLDVSVDEYKAENTIKAGNKIAEIQSLNSGAFEIIYTYYEVKQTNIEVGKVNENDELEIEIIHNTVTAKPQEIEEKHDDEIVPVNPYTERKVTKKWKNDNDNKYNTRPSQIVVKLYADGNEVQTAIIKPNELGEWKHTFTKLLKYNDFGEQIVYTITENDVLYYDKNVPTTDMQEYIITNTMNQEKINIPVNKIWIDNDNKYNTRPSQIVVKLYADGNEVQTTTIEADKSGNWNYTFTDLPKYNSLGNEIIYKITENDIADYAKSIENYNITNTLKPENSTSISGTKIWIDKNNEYNTRPSQITINLKIGENVVKSQIVKPDSNGDWKYEFSNLPTKDVNGNEINYSIQEITVPNYDKGEIQVDSNNKNIINIKNTIKQVDTSVSVNKVWNIPEGTTGGTIRVYVYQDGVRMDDQYVDLTYGIKSTHTFNGLPKYNRKVDGTVSLYEYTVKEEKEDKSKYTQYMVDENNNGNNNFTITNTAQGVIEEITTQTTNNPIDVVFVLDVSASMKNNNKGTSMVSAVNNTINTIKQHNSDSRVGIVTFSTGTDCLGKNNAQVIQPLANINNINTLSGDNTAITYGNTTIQLYNATYTQSGIEKGGKMLSEAQAPQGSTLTNRTPILILLTDGEPTFHCESYANVADVGISDAIPVEGYNSGPGWDTTPKNVYYTILTANYWKGKIEENYGVANFYTIGVGIDTPAMRATLDPTESNINNYNANQTDRYKFSGHNSLSSYFNEENKNKSSFDYSDATYINESVDASTLQQQLNNFVTGSQKLTKRMITSEEINSNNVVLNNVDTSKIFTITCANGNYTSLQAAIDAGIAEQNGTTVTIDLRKTGLSSQIKIKYYKI